MTVQGDKIDGAQRVDLRLLHQLILQVNWAGQLHGHFAQRLALARLQPMFHVTVTPAFERGFGQLIGRYSGQFYCKPFGTPPGQQHMG